MKRLPVFLLLCLLVLGTVARATPPETRLARYPDISQDLVVFVYAGDLWTTPRAGGLARRLTVHPGDERFPKFSPDGRWIAFTGEYDGNADVFVIPAEGGEPRRLTYHPGTDIVLGWTPDGTHVLFRSTRISWTPRFQRLFLVPLEGGLPEPLPVPRGGLTSFSPDGQRIAYNPVAREFRTWKRYRGGWEQYIGIYDLEENTYEELPRVNANDMFPMWHGEGIYFISDREGVMNLYRYDVNTRRTRRLTHYREYDVKWPSLGPDAIIYENGGRLYAFDLERERPTLIPVSVASDLIVARAEIKPVAENIRFYNLSPNAVRALFEARGELFTVPVEHGSARNLTNTPGVHERRPAWSPDGRWVAYLADPTGEYEIYLVPQKGGEPVRITFDGRVYRYGPLWSPDSQKLLFWDKEHKLWYVDIEDKQPVLIDYDPYDEFDGGSWSSDSRWVVYSKHEPSFSQSIYLYSLEEKKTFPVTDSFYNDFNPVFDPNGKNLYFLSDRFFFPSSGQFDSRFNYYNTTGIFALTLQADQPSPFALRSDEEEVKEEEKEEKEEKPQPEKNEQAQEPPAEEPQPEEKPEEEKEKKKGPQAIQIDTEGIGQRLAQVPVPPGTYRSLQARKGKLFYLAIPFESQQAGVPGPPRPRNTLYLFDLKKRERKPLLQGINDYNLDKDGKKVIYRAGKVFGVVDAVPGKAKVGQGKLNTASLQTLVDPRAEWEQIFHEAWRIERDFYWDPNMGGLDWEEIGQRYQALLPWVAHRSDLNYIIGEMIAELSTSHTYVGGGEMPESRRVNVGLLGVDFEADQGFYRIARIYRGENWNPQTRSPLSEPGLKVEEGDYLIAVNGNRVRVPKNPYGFFQNLAGKVVTLTINDQPGEEGAWEILVKPSGSENGVRYLDWVERKRRQVEEATGGRVAYMHVPNTSISGLIMFDKYLTGQLGKQALIIDERYNSGGMIPDFYTEKLKRQRLNMIAPREGEDVAWPPVAIHGPKVMLINEHAGSGGDAFPWYFKREGIGPVVGMRTWGGLIGISRIVPLMDGGVVTAPEFAFWSTDNGGEWIVENYGVDPDYEVPQRPDLVVAGHDPQLEKAIELVLEALEDYPPPPQRPPYPRKR